MSKPLSPAIRYAIIGGAMVLLLAIYITQRIDYASAILGDHLESPNLVFILNRLLRFLINDLMCIALIYALFENKRYVRLAWYVFLVELFFILPVYFFFKLTLEGPSELSSPFLSQIHRIVVNPLLMFTLIAALYYQRYISQK